jgi:hypothetical protein
LSLSGYIPSNKTLLHKKQMGSLITDLQILSILFVISSYPCEWQDLRDNIVISISLLVALVILMLGKGLTKALVRYDI